MLRFIHTADIHLGRTVRSRMDMPERFLKAAREAAYLSFQRIIDEAVKREVDFVLISGDVYDNEERSLRGQWFIKKQAERLQEKGINLLIIHGNHDPLKDKTKLVSMPENVHIFTEKVMPFLFSKNEQKKAYIYGFSYPQKAFVENPVPLYKKEADDEAYHIAMLHGQEKQQQDHEPYAPFTIRELLSLDFDYWALGHIHKRQLLSEKPPIVYPGNVQGATRKETGEKGAYYIELSKTSTKLMFFETALLQWEKAELSINELDTIDELISSIEEQLNIFFNTEKTFFVVLTISGSGILHEQLMDLEKQQELLSLLREEMNVSSVWIDRLEIETVPVINRDQLRGKDHLLADVVKVVDDLKENIDLEEALNPVYSHSGMKRYVEKLTDPEKEKLISEAETRLITFLLREGEKG